MADKAVHIAFYPSDWLAGTRGLTPAEAGVYITLVCMMYERQAPFAFDQARLARMCNCPAGTFKKILAVLIDEGKLIETPDGLWQRRVEQEILAAQNAMTEASERGKRAAGARWGNAKGQSDHREIAKVKPQSDEQQNASRTGKKGNEISASNIQAQCPSNANQNQNQNIDDDYDRRGRENDPGLMEMVCDAAGRSLGSLNGNATRFGMSPAEVDALRRWQADLGLAPDSIVAEVRHQASRMRTPANSLTYFTPGMQQLAARLAAPRLEPIEGAQNDPRNQRSPASNRRADAADDAFVRRINAAAQVRGA